MNMGNNGGLKAEDNTQAVLGWTFD